MRSPLLERAGGAVDFGVHFRTGYDDACHDRRKSTTFVAGAAAAAAASVLLPVRSSSDRGGGSSRASGSSRGALTPESALVAPGAFVVFSVVDQGVGLAEGAPLKPAFYFLLDFHARAGGVLRALFRMDRTRALINAAARPTLTLTLFFPSAESLGRIWEPFRQADNGAQRRFGGSGLGLTINARIAAALGGHLDAYSEGAGKGCRFEFWLPARVVPTALTGKVGAPLEGIQEWEPRPASTDSEAPPEVPERTSQSLLERPTLDTWGGAQPRKLRKGAAL